MDKIGEQLQLTKNQNGFTFVEMVIVVTIIGVIASFAFPSLSALRMRSKLRTDVREFVASFNYMKSEALRRNRTLGLLFDTPTSGDYSVFLDDGKGGGTADDAVKHADEDILIIKSLKSGVLFGTNTFTSNYPGFDFRGLPKDDETGDIILFSNYVSDLRYKIILSLAGTVTIQSSDDGGNHWE